MRTVFVLRASFIKTRWCESTVLVQDRVPIECILYCAFLLVLDHHYIYTARDGLCMHMHMLFDLLRSAGPVFWRGWLVGWRYIRLMVGCGHQESLLGESFVTDDRCMHEMI